MKKTEVNKIIKESLKLNDSPQQLDEAYFARAREYDLKTELLLSKTKQAHKELYEQYVEKFNDVSARLDTASRTEAGANHSDFRSLKRNEAYLMNAIHLHELYFANISDPYSEIVEDSYAFMRLTRDFGTFEEWQHDFIACAMSARNGWVVTGLSTYLQRYVNIVVDGHDVGSLVGFYPVFVLDMFEHARRDYLNNKKDYIVAMMREIDWSVVENRVMKADALLKVLRQ